MRQENVDDTLYAFMGGTEDYPNVMIYNPEDGLTMIDLMDGDIIWTIPNRLLGFGTNLAYIHDPKAGVLYITGSGNPNLYAISANGDILWIADCV